MSTHKTTIKSPRNSRKRHADNSLALSRPAVSEYFSQPSTSSPVDDHQKKVLKKNLSTFSARAKTVRLGRSSIDVVGKSRTVLAEPQPCCSTSSVDTSEADSLLKKSDNVLDDLILQAEETLDIDHVDVTPPTNLSEGRDASDELSPFEHQFLDLKSRYPDVLLLIEAGYLFRMFGEDALVARDVLKFRTSSSHQLLRTGFPSSTLHSHLRTLVSRGYKVGVVRKTESTLDKSRGLGRNDIFGRELTALYTRSTMLGEDVNPIKPTDNSVCWSDRLCGGGGAAVNYLMCLYEISTNSETRIGILATCLESGDILFDHFRDDERRCQLDNRLARIKPVEIIIPDGCLTYETERTIEVACQSSPFGESVRIERMSDHHFKFNHARETLRGFYDAQEVKIEDLGSPVYCDSWSKVDDLPPLVVCCLSATYAFLCDFKLESVLKLVGQAKNISEDGTGGHLEMDARTVHTLELFRSRSCGQSEGSFVQAFDRTSTAFGARLLRSWINQPLRNVREINQRLETVDALSKDGTSLVDDIRRFLTKLPDLEKGISTIFHRKCSTHLYWKVVNCFLRVRDFLSAALAQEFSVPIQSILTRTVALLANCDELLVNLNPDACKLGIKARLFEDVTRYSEVASTLSEILNITEKLENLRPIVGYALQIDDFQYSVFNGYEFVILINSASSHSIPVDWVRVFSSKSKVCYRTREMDQLVKNLSMLKDHLKYQCQLAWLDYLENFKKHYHKLRCVVQNLATLDCLTMFANLAKSNGLSRPLVTDSDAPYIQIKKGFHFTLQSVLGFDKHIVANDTNLAANDTSCFIISGCNMGGKSTYINQVGLIAIMAQIGSFVPAVDVKMSPFGAIFARSRPADSLVEGKSTFYVEMEEVTRMLERARRDSLLLLDELGCGTCDVDGAAITEGLLRHVISETRCLVLCVTPFADVTTLESHFKNSVANYHLAVYMDDTTEDVAYLYELRPGARFEGLARHVAKRAGFDESVLLRASRVSRNVETSAIAKILFKKMMLVSSNELQGQDSKLIDQIDSCF